MNTDENLFPTHWGLQDVVSGLQGNDFPDRPDFPDPMADSGAAVNYLSPFVRDFEFTNIVSWEIAGNYFYNLPQQPIGKKIEWVKEPECKTEIEPQTLWIYREQSGEKGYQAGKDELLYTIKIFISTNNAKLKKLYDFMQNGVADDEILFFMEDNTGDLSDQSLYVRFGKKVDKDFLLQMSDKNLDSIAQSMPDFDRNKLRELISTGEVKAPITPLRGLLFMALNISTITGATGKALGWLSEQIGEAVEYLMIPESLWDSKSEDYFLKQENVTEVMQLDTSFLKQWRQYIEQSDNWKILAVVSPAAEWMPEILGVVQNMADWYNVEIAAVVNLIYRRYEQGVEHLDEVIYLSEQIAFLCGLWNGLVDFVAGIFKFLGTLLQAQYDIVQNFQAVLEAIDDFREGWAAFSFADFFEAAWQLQQDMLVELIVFLTTPNPRDSYNFDRIAYTGGFGVGFIASFFIPLANVSKVSTIAKFSKFIPEEFVTTLNIARTQSIKGYKAMVRLLEDIAEFLGKKGDELYQELKKLLDKLLAWIKRNKKRFEKIDNIVDENILRRFIRRNHIKGDIDVAYVLRISNNRKDLAESLLLSLKEIKEGKTVIQLVRYFKITDPPLLASLSNYQARIWYSWKKMQIERQIRNIRKLDDKAKKAFELRNEYRTATRQYMKDRNWADYLEQVEKNMTWEEILERTLRKDEVKTLEDAYNEIIQASMSGRDKIDKLFKIEKK